VNNINIEDFLYKIENILSTLNTEDKEIKVVDAIEQFSKLVLLVDPTLQKDCNNHIENKNSIEMAIFRINKFSLFLEAIDTENIDIDIFKAVLRDIYSLFLSLNNNNQIADDFEDIDLIAEILEQLPYVIFWKDINGRYKGANKALANIAGFKEVADLIGHYDSELPWSPSEALHYMRCDQRVICSGVSEINIEETQKQANGHDVHLMTSKVPLKNKKGEIIGLLGIFSDITDRKNTEIALEKSTKNMKDSIQFASLIQQAILPQKDILQNYTNDSFTIWPKRYSWWRYILYCRIR
jgi:PAS domain S-box-containing protein